MDAIDILHRPGKRNRNAHRGEEVCEQENCLTDHKFIPQLRLTLVQRNITLFLQSLVAVNTLLGCFLPRLEPRHKRGFF